MSERQAKEEIDPKVVDKIVDKMKKKFEAEGTDYKKPEGGLGELRGLILEGPDHALKIQNVEELAEFKSPLISTLGRFYLKLRNPLRPLAKMLATLPQAQTLNFYLYAANMHYSLSQYFVLTTAVTVIAAIAGLITGSITAFLLNANIWVQLILVILFTLLFGIIAALLMLWEPKRKAESRGNEVSTELPFALRHMATELKSGIGLYRTIQIIAQADYGVLSQEFAKTITEIEQGTDAQEALRSTANRVQSKGLRNALLHMVRAMKTGGNLSEVMTDIAEDIASEQQNQIREFAEKMNFFGVIFIFSIIVMPAMVLTMAGIRAAPLPMQIDIPVTPAFMGIMFFVIMPAIMAVFIFYLKSTQPRV